MPKRICDSHGEEVDVQGGKTCPKGHFICKKCVWSGSGGGLLGDGLKTCPICKQPLR
jgi:hypothetical protein